jgi:hypothetical protein
MRAVSIAVRLAVALAVVAVLSCATIWLIRPSSAVTLAEKNKQGVSSESSRNNVSSEQPKECLPNPNNPAVSDCPSGTSKCGSGDSYTCCGPKQRCCVKSDGTPFCSDGRCPN